MRSGKFKALKEILKAWFVEKHKVLLFTQTVMVVEMLEKMCQE